MVLLCLLPLLCAIRSQTGFCFLENRTFWPFRGVFCWGHPPSNPKRRLLSPAQRQIRSFSLDSQMSKNKAWSSCRRQICRRKSSFCSWPKMWHRSQTSFRLPMAATSRDIRAFCVCQMSPQQSLFSRWETIVSLLTFQKASFCIQTCYPKRQIPQIPFW